MEVDVDNSTSFSRSSHQKLLLKSEGICFFCLSRDESPNNVSNFSLRNIVRFLKIDPILLANGRRDSEILVSACDECVKIMTEFSELYHRLQVVKLHLMGCVRTIYNLMRRADRDEVRKTELKKRLSKKKRGRNPRRLSMVNNLRSETIEKCSAKLNASVPRVRLERIDAINARKKDLLSEIIQPPSPSVVSLSLCTSAQLMKGQNQDDVKLIIEKRDIAVQVEEDLGLDVDEIKSNNYDEGENNNVLRDTPPETNDDDDIIGESESTGENNFKRVIATTTPERGTKRTFKITIMEKFSSPAKSDSSDFDLPLIKQEHLHEGERTSCQSSEDVSDDEVPLAIRMPKAKGKQRKVKTTLGHGHEETSSHNQESHDSSTGNNREKRNGIKRKIFSTNDQNSSELNETELDNKTTSGLIATSGSSSNPTGMANQNLGKKVMKCSICGEPFSELEKLRYHKSIHTPENLATLSFPCPRTGCNSVFKFYYSLRAHSLRLHPLDGFGKYVSSNTSEAEMKIVLKLALDRCTKQSPKSKVQCMFCKFKHPELSETEGHVLVTHFEKLTTLISEISRERKGKEVEIEVIEL